jgi:hypothetical protein
MMRLILAAFFALTLLGSTTPSSADDDACSGESWTVRRCHETWGDYYARKQHEVDREDSADYTYHKRR